MLLRNLDKMTITNPNLKDTIKASGLNTARTSNVSPSMKDDRVQISIDLKSSFTDFKLEEVHKPDKRNFI
jgi:hypothetical protein